MKKSLVLYAIFFLSGISAQNYDSYNIDLISLIHPNTDSLGPSVGNKYSGCWGWYQDSTNKEYAISGGTNGTYFIDVSNPATPSVSAFVPGKLCTWREMKTYKNYCYVVSDYCRPNTFQIIDMQYLPDSVHVIHNSNTYFELGHTIWIDNDKMYIGLTTFAGTSGGSAMTVWSLATPTAPLLLRRIEQDSAAVGKIFEVHDMYARNDTVYASAGWQGIRILKLQSNNTFSLIGSYDGYPEEGYNHSSYLTENGRYLLFCDEVPSSLPMHFVDLQNPGNIQPVKHWKPHEKTTPHNPYIIGNSHAIVSCYQDGLFIYDISQPPVINLAGFFDTYPQGGVNAPDSVGYGGSAYRGNWGAYPFLPSGIIIANDMQNGVFILDPESAYTTTVQNHVGLPDKKHYINELLVFPNPANNKINIYLKDNQPYELSLKNMLGEVVMQYVSPGELSRQLDLSGIPAGTYFITVNGKNGIVNKKMIVTH